MHQLRSKSLLGLTAAMLLPILACAGSAAAAVDGPTAVVAVKALNFLQPKPAKPTPVAIVTDSGQAAAGDQLKGALGADVAAKVVDGAGGDLTGAVAVIVAGASDISGKAASGQLVIGDMACMEAGKCALAVERQASGAAKYHVNTAALTKAGVSFDKNFQMLVTAH
ncbi:hypothetical protein [Niveispirillum sp. KHB5.9]|uniref:hypothetical protein n=1 Tax=Niveispirillum sp. KHB5.9 TaxID=3400269 RepID=UPI003A85699A